ncbi:MAG: zinc ribbon domain-containing protein, partial [Syntrophales bacterium LBB04]|nr:zinc ribbon domain-containing protein [Syntrophales bacterium LBB04]
MKCPKCHTENPDEKKFCRKCGASLSTTCRHCGAAVAPDDDYCGECGQKPQEAPSRERQIPEPAGERKHVTVLFSDLSGYTALSEHLDPEELKEFTGSLFGDISKVIERYGGFVEKYIGDAVMAVFGVPSAHEDDPVRAIRAGREIHQIVSDARPGLSMHTGINTGLV